MISERKYGRKYYKITVVADYAGVTRLHNNVFSLCVKTITIGICPPDIHVQCICSPDIFLCVPSRTFCIFVYKYSLLYCVSGSLSFSRSVLSLLHCNYVADTVIKLYNNMTVVGYQLAIYMRCMIARGLYPLIYRMAMAMMPLNLITKAQISLKELTAIMHGWSNHYSLLIVLCIVTIKSAYTVV